MMVLVALLLLEMAMVVAVAELVVVFVNRNWDARPLAKLDWRVRLIVITKLCPTRPTAKTV